MKEGIFRLGINLMLVCLAAAGGLYAVNRLTREGIERQALSARQASLRVVLPAAGKFSELIRGSRLDYYAGYDDSGRIVGHAFTGSAPGYGGPVTVMVGLDTAGNLTGIDILEQHETPGLGDNVAVAAPTRSVWDVLFGRPAPAARRPWFQEQFAGKNPGEIEISLGKSSGGVAAVSGATVTSRAVTKAVREAADAFLEQEKGPDPEGTR